METAYLDLEFEEFQKMKTPGELHKLATKCYFYIQQWVVESEFCSEATALMLFWDTSPYEFIRLGWKTKVGTNEDFDFIRTIINNFEKGFYLKTDIRYNPAEKIAKAEKIPDIVLQPSIGEEPYIYIDANEVKSWFGENLYNKIKRCDSTIELYNIAIALKHCEWQVYEQVIEHPYCDKAIALHTYWLLDKYVGFNLYAQDWLNIKPVIEKIVSKLQNKEYKEVLSYDPNKEVKPIKWEIPDLMFQKIN